MLSFDVSVIDLVLLIAVIIILILYITKPATNSVTKENLSNKEIFSSEKLDKTSPKTEKEETTSTQPQTNLPKCSYSFGYLVKLKKDQPIPDECLNCPRIMECLYPNK